MSRTIHFANTDAEFEYANPTSSLEENWKKHPLCLQLQYLPFLYADSEDSVAVSSLSSAYLEHIKKLEWRKEKSPIPFYWNEDTPIERGECHSWSFSKHVKEWSTKRNFSYPIPDWETVCKVNSKAFSFQYSVLKDAALITNQEELYSWVEKNRGMKVLKTCYGLSGMGNRLISQLPLSAKVIQFCEQEWKQNFPIIGEPWLNRIFDFSTQWFIHRDQRIEYLGATHFKTDANGIYQGTLAGPEEKVFSQYDFFLKEHRDYVEKVLQDITGMGFWGNIGFDAFVYLDNKTKKKILNPIVEINARKTMSWVVLEIQRKYYPRETLKMSFEKASSHYVPLLPSQAVNFEGEIVKFSRNLSLVLMQN